MRTIALASGLLCLWFGMPAAATCSCLESDPAAAFNSAKAVFIAEVIEGKAQVSVPSDQGTSRLVEVGEVRIAVAEVFKGQVGREATVFNSDGDSSCRVKPLQRGKQYVFYAYGSKDDTNLYSSPCTRTGALDSDEVREDLQFLRSLPAVGSGGTLRGSVRENRRSHGSTPLPEVTVQIQGPAEQFSATTGPDGQFEVKGLPPGKYRVEPKYPRTHLSERRFIEVEISDLTATEVGFEAFINGELLVRTVDRQGRPFNNAHPQLEEVQLINHNFPWPTQGYPVGAGGDFLLRGIPPGEYFLYLTVEDAREHRRQKYFYPGTFNQSEAVRFKMGPAEKKRAAPDFRLPEGFNIRSVSGRVLLKDGKPATRSRVSLNCGTSSDAPMLADSAFSVPVDAKGRFRIDAIVGQKYLLSAYGYDSAEALVQSPKTLLEIAPGQEALEQDLLLSESGYTNGCKP